MKNMIAMNCISLFPARIWLKIFLQSPLATKGHINPSLVCGWTSLNDAAQPVWIMAHEVCLPGTGRLYLATWVRDSNQWDCDSNVFQSSTCMTHKLASRWKTQVFVARVKLPTLLTGNRRAPRSLIVSHRKQKVMKVRAQSYPILKNWCIHANKACTSSCGGGRGKQSPSQIREHLFPSLRAGLWLH